MTSLELRQQQRQRHQQLQTDEKHYFNTQTTLTMACVDSQQQRHPSGHRGTSFRSIDDEQEEYHDDPYYEDDLTEYDEDDNHTTEYDEQDDNEDDDDDGDISIAASITTAQSSVRFAENIVHPIPTLDEMPPEVIQAVWYDDVDYQGFRKHCELSVEEIEKGKTLKDKKHSALGLDGWTKKGYEKRERHRIDSIDAVMDEQFAQWDDGKDDFDSIADLYKHKTEHPQMVANTKGLIIEREVKEYLSTSMDDYETQSIASYYDAKKRRRQSFVRSQSHSSLTSLNSRGNISVVSALSSSFSDRDGDDDSQQTDPKQRFFPSSRPPSPTPSVGSANRVIYRSTKPMTNAPPRPKDMAGRPPPSPTKVSRVPLSSKNITDNRSTSCSSVCSNTSSKASKKSVSSKASTSTKSKKEKRPLLKKSPSVTSMRSTASSKASKKSTSSKTSTKSKSKSKKDKKKSTRGSETAASVGSSKSKKSSKSKSSKKSSSSSSGKKKRDSAATAATAESSLSSESPPTTPNKEHKNRFVVLNRFPQSSPRYAAPRNPRTSSSDDDDSSLPPVYPTRVPRGNDENGVNVSGVASVASSSSSKKPVRKIKYIKAPGTSTGCGKPPLPEAAGTSASVVSSLSGSLPTVSAKKTKPTANTSWVAPLSMPDDCAPSREVKKRTPHTSEDDILTATKNSEKTGRISKKKKKKDSIEQEH